MNVYYEKHRDAHGKLVLTEMRLSSYSGGVLAINFNSLSEKTSFEICKQILKWPPVAMRSYDDASKVWTYLGNYGELVLEKLREVTKTLGGITEYEIVDLNAQCLIGRIDLKKQPKIRPEDFFYNTAPQGAAALTREQIAAKLSEIMQVTPAAIDKKAYRAAAMRLHPDRNHGDGSKMSDLNMYWGLYNA